MRAIRRPYLDDEGLAQKPADFIATHPVFTLGQFCLNHVFRGRGYGAARSLLKYHLRTGRLSLIRRGLFGHPGNLDPWLLGSLLAPDAVLAYGGALSFHGIAGLGHQMAYRTAFPRKTFEWNEVIYQPVRVRPNGLYHPEPETVLRCGLPVRVTRAEQALVDVLHRPDLGPLEFAVEHLRNERTLPLKEVVHHARLLKHPTLNARLGYVLASRPDVTRDDLHALECALPPRSVWLDPRWKEGQLIPRWRLRVPRYLRELIEGTTWRSQSQRQELILALSMLPLPRQSAW